MKILRSFWIKAIILFFIYFITARFGLSLGAVRGFATLVWFPTGISLAALLIFGYRLWPAIALGAFLVNISVGAPLLAAAGIAAGNTLEAVLGAYLARRFTKFNTSLNNLHNVLAIVLIATPFSTLVSATIGVGSLLLTHAVPSSAFILTWTPWWIGDLISDLVVAPFLLVWSTKPLFALQPKRVLEFGALIIVGIIVNLLVFQGFLRIDAKNFSITYLVFPILIWTSLRFGQRETATAVFLLSALAVWSTAQGFGPFAKGNLVQNLLFLQSFMGITAITALILAAALAERRELEQRKNRFITMASHELKTPITGMKIFIEILRTRLEKGKDLESLRIVNRIYDQTGKLTDLVNDLLDVSRIQTGKLLLRKEVFRMDELITDTIEGLKGITKKHDLLFQAKIPLTVYGDRYRMYQALTNLITNAVKYSPKGGPILIKITRSKYNALISVRDEGIGIAPEEQQKIFQKLYQVESFETATPGLGMGLYISKEIVERHDGNMWVKSRKGMGSTFYFTIPLYNDENLKVEFNGTKSRHPKE